MKKEGDFRMSHYTQSKVTVIGHIHPDTDSVCSAIAYAWLKNQAGEPVYEARCAGPINRETEFALNYFEVPAPEICEDVNPCLKDITFRSLQGIDPEMSVLEAWNLMRDIEINTICVTDQENHLLGLITLKDMANANMDLLDTSILASARTPYRNILQTLKGKLLCGSANDCVTKGRICIGTSSAMLRATIHPGDLVILSDQLDVQQCALSCGVSCLILCCGASPSPEILEEAELNDCTVITTNYDSYQAARLISTAVPVRSLMIKEGLMTFHISTPLKEIKKTMAKVRFQYFPVLDEKGKYCGVISRRNLLNLKRRQLILVDHNEKTQAVEGIGEADILEIIDHHRLGAPETDAPVIFRNMPVGCTSTILYQIFMEQQVTPPREIAGLMLSAILSDTLMFRSPTCTVFDKTAAQALAELAEVSLTDYAEKMFAAGSDLSGKSADDLLFSDIKIFFFGEAKIGIGQICLMSEKACTEAEELLLPYLETGRKKADITELFFMVTNTSTKHTRVLFSGENAADILSDAFQRPAQSRSMDLPGVVSRKKQVLPRIKAVLR